MSNSQSNPPTSSSGGSGFSLFGQPTSSAGGPSSSGSNLFGNIPGSSSGTSTPSSNPFGGQPTQSLFGASASSGNQGASTGLFGGGGFKLGGTSDENKKPESTNNLFGGFSTPNRSSTPQTSSQPQTTSLFGATAFGANSTSSGPASNNTPPAGRAGFAFGNPSTTPAGPPPSTSAQSLFQPKPTTGSGPSLFASIGASTSTDRTSQTPSPFQGQSQQPSSNLFGSQSQVQSPSNQGPSAGTGTAASQSASSLFGAHASVQQSTSNIFGQRQTGSPAIPVSQQKNDQGTASQSNQSLFASPAPQQAHSASSTLSAPGNATASAFPTQPSSSAAPAAPSASQGVSQQQSSAPAVDAQGSTSTSSSSTAPTFTNLFGSGSQVEGPKSTAAPASNLFSAPGQKKDDAAPVTNEQSLSSSAATAVGQTTTSAPPPSLFAPHVTATKPNESSSAADSAAAAPSTAQNPSAGSAVAAASLGSSTIGPAPVLQSRLKNKSMDEIITRWASDLSKYQKEFQAQADKVAAWDRMLLENGNRISKLYNKTFQAERDTAEIQKQLSAVESHQDELSQWLDRYEQEVDEMMARQIGQGEALQGPDQERERTYKTAARVSERLGEIGKDLSSMIEEINAASATITKTTKQDDPLSQIVRILNHHLSKLQEIDQTAAALDGRVRAAQRENQRLGSRGVHTRAVIDADDFYRSYVGSR